MKSTIIKLLGGYTHQELEQFAIQVAHETQVQIEQAKIEIPIVHGFLHHKFNPIKQENEG